MRTEPIRVGWIGQMAVPQPESVLCWGLCQWRSGAHPGQRGFPPCQPTPAHATCTLSPSPFLSQGGGKVTYNVIKTRLGDLLYKLRCVNTVSPVYVVLTACLLRRRLHVSGVCLGCVSGGPAAQAECASTHTSTPWLPCFRGEVLRSFEDPAEGEEALEAKSPHLNISLFPPPSFAAVPRSLRTLPRARTRSRPSSRRSMRRSRSASTPWRRSTGKAGPNADLAPTLTWHRLRAGCGAGLAVSRCAAGFHGGLHPVQPGWHYQPSNARP